MLNANRSRATGISAKCRKCGSPYIKYEWSICDTCMNTIFRDIEKSTKKASMLMPKNEGTLAGDDVRRLICILTEEELDNLEEQ